MVSRQFLKKKSTYSPKHTQSRYPMRSLSYLVAPPAGCQQLPSPLFDQLRDPL
jgi:hypothetical protein